MVRGNVDVYERTQSQVLQLHVSFASSTTVCFTSRNIALTAVDEARCLGLHIHSMTGFQAST